MQKILLRPERLRRVPAQFSWVDQRLFRASRTAACDSDALALYLFLVTVADAQGVSFYSDPSLARILRWEALRLGAARQRLVGAALPVGEILRRVLGSGGAS